MGIMYDSGVLLFWKIVLNICDFGTDEDEALSKANTETEMNEMCETSQTSLFYFRLFRCSG